jgi:hypothetical protein
MPSRMIRVVARARACFEHAIVTRALALDLQA